MRGFGVDASLCRTSSGTIPTREHGGVRAGFQNQELAPPCLGECTPGEGDGET